MTQEDRIGTVLKRLPSFKKYWHARAQRYQKWQQIWTTVLARDHHACVYCGHTPKDGIKLHVENKSGNEDPPLDSLVTVCENCILGRVTNQSIK